MSKVLAILAGVILGITGALFYYCFEWGFKRGIEFTPEKAKKTD